MNEENNLGASDKGYTHRSKYKLLGFSIMIGWKHWNNYQYDTTSHVLTKHNGVLKTVQLTSYGVSVSLLC